MKLASTPTLLLVLNLSASMASDQHLRVRQLTNTTDAANSTVSPAPAPTVSPAPTTSEPTTWEPTTCTWETYVPTTNSTTVTYAPTANVTVSPAPTTSEPTAAPEPTPYPTVEPCSTLVSIRYYNDYSWSELPDCVQDAAGVFRYNQNKWDSGQESCPSFCDEWWGDLTSRQKSAAFVLSYNRRRWNGQ